MVSRRRSSPASSSTVAVVVSRYNASITGSLLQGAITAWKDAGLREEDLLVVTAPGAFELTSLCAAAARRRGIRGVLALGCIIKGETRHDEYLASAVAHGLTEIGVHFGIPVSFGVLTVNSVRQARARAGLAGAKANKGAEAMSALLETLAEIQRVRAPDPGTRTSSQRPDKALRSRRTTG